MTKRFIVSLAVVLLIAATSSAQTASVSAFATNPGYGTSSFSGGHYTGAWGVGAEYWFSPRVSAAVAVTQEHYYVPTTSIYPVTTYERRALYPVDALARYHFDGNERWKPYVGVGFRVFRMTSQVWDFSNPAAPVAVRYGSTAVDPQINAGVTLMLNRSLGIDFDAKRTLSDPAGRPVDQFRASLGLSWRF